MRDLAGRTALVTGASHGIGQYIARALAAERMISPGFVADAGMYRTLQDTTHLSAPGWLGTSKPEDVARAVVRAITQDLPEVIVNPGPMRLMLAFRDLFPRLADRVRVDVFERAARFYESRP